MNVFVGTNRLLIIFFLLFAASMMGQIITGFHVCNLAITEQHGKAFLLPEYLSSGHFAEAVFENWQGDFLLLSIFVFISFSASAQRQQAFVNGKRTVIFFVLFLMFFGLHFYSSLLNHNNTQILGGMPVENVFDYIRNEQFWFECFQKWQSLFLCLFVLVLFNKQRSRQRV